MALADGRSQIVCNELSLHSQTMIALLRIFIPEIEIRVEDIGERAKLIEI